MSKVKIFEKFLNTFETEELKEYCKDMINAAPEYIWKIPSSTSYKYHNKTQCQPGGQIYHILMTCEIMNYILGLEYVQKKWENPKQRDCFRVAICLHDMLKCGGHFAQEPLFTVHEHPIETGEWVEETVVEHDIDQKLKRYISRLIQSHSGQWTRSPKYSTVLPSVENDEQFLIHLCDYLGSRANLDMTYDEEVTNLVQSFQELPDINTYELPFGKHKGLTLMQIDKIDHDYITWAKSNIDKEPVKSLLKEI